MRQLRISRKGVYASAVWTTTLVVFALATWACSGSGGRSRGSGPAVAWPTVGPGDAHTIAVKSGGTLWGWGDNRYGQLGNGTTVGEHYAPEPIGTATSWSSVAAGRYHTVAVRADGTLWAWGDTSYGQLGDGTSTNRLEPGQIGTATSWASVAAGDHHTVAARTDGTLWAWGNNSHGQPGDGTTSDRSSPKLIGSGWISAIAGSDRTFARKADGTLWGWGYDGDGELGIGTPVSARSPARIPE